MNKDINKSWGIVTLLFWSTEVFFYIDYPLSSWRMSGWIFYFGVFTVFAGIVSGVLLLTNPRSGRLLAVGISAIVIVFKLGHIISSFPYISDRLYATYVLFMKVKPIQVLYIDVLSPIFFISTIYVFILKSKKAGKGYLLAISALVSLTSGNSFSKRFS